jgi:hypothetical protein
MLACLALKAAVEGRLAAAGLGRWKVDFNSKASENANHAHADVGKELIYQTGDKQGDFHS